MWIWMLCMAAAVAFDQLTKHLVVHFLAPSGSREVIPSLLKFTYAENEGMAFGLLDESGQRWIFMSVSVIAILGLLFYLWKYKPKEKLLCAGLSLIVGGGVGNMVDRLFYTGVSSCFGKKCVIDFIDFYVIWPYIFNVADACVCIGAGLIALYLIVDIVREVKKEKEKKLCGVCDQTEEIKEEKTEENE